MYYCKRNLNSWDYLRNEKVRRYFSSSHIKNRTVQSMVLTIEAREKRLREMSDKNVKNLIDGFCDDEKLDFIEKR